MKINLDLPTRSQRTKKQINFNSKHKREQTTLHTISATSFGVVLLRKSVLCILSDAPVRKYVPVRHEHKGGEQNNSKQKSTDQPTHILTSDLCILISHSALAQRLKNKMLEK